MIGTILFGMAVMLGSCQGPSLPVPGSDSPAPSPSSSSGPAPEVLAQAGEVQVTRTEFESYLELYHPSEHGGLPLDNAERVKLLQQMLEEKLLMEEAVQRKLDQDAAVKAQIERHRARVLGNALEEEVLKQAVTEDAVQAYYNDHRAELVFEQARVSQILFLAPAGAKAEQVEGARGRAEEAQKRLDRGEPFEQVARELSEDALTRDRGGDLGLVRVDKLLKPLAAELATMGPGEVRGPIMTPYGFHLLKLEGEIVTVELAFEEARPEIELRLRELAWGEFKKALLDRNKVHVFTDRL